MSGEVEEVMAPAAIEEWAGLTGASYVETFTFRADCQRNSESWARLILEGATRSQRLAMIATWTALGIPLRPPWSSRQILGWRMVLTTPSVTVLGVRSLTGLSARLVVHVEAGRVTQAMVVRYDRRPARLIWTRLAPRHRDFVKGLLVRASRSPA